ncbi:hypothetical protein LCGC14_2972030, partial [marine sediment metagenome]
LWAVRRVGEIIDELDLKGKNDELVKELAPMVKDFAWGQFRKGILVHKDGVEQAMKEFPTTIVPLLRKDAERLIPKKTFDRVVFSASYTNPYRSRVTGDDRPPDAENIRADEAALTAVLTRWKAEGAGYPEARAKVIAGQFRDAITLVSERLMTRVLTGNLMLRQMGTFIEGVDYADAVQEKLTAREMAMKGRRQDLAKLTADGVPDTAAPLVALMFGASKGHGANLEPVMTSMVPAMITDGDIPAMALLPAKPVWPQEPAEWGFEEQPAVKPQFQTARFEGIPFLRRFPRLDGDLSDWGKIRPLILRPPREGGKAILVYAAWNYQGFFFGYRVAQDSELFYYPSLWRMSRNHNTGGVGFRRVTGVNWAIQG